MDGTIIQQGKFTSDGLAKQLDIRSDVDWMVVYNQTQWATTQSTGRGVKFFWQRGLSDGQAFEYTKADSSTNVLQGEFVSAGGFSLLDTASQAPDAQVTGTTITKASAAVCSASNSYSNGDIVRIYNTDEMAQIDGMLYTISSVSGSAFTLSYMDTNTSNFTASTSFNVRKISNDAQYAPRARYITAVTAASSAVVTMSVTHGYAVGEVVSFRVPSAFGMTQLNNLYGTITAVSTANNTITVDIDSSAFTAFAWPAASAAPLTFAQVVPVGSANEVLSDATDNVSIIGMELGAGIDGPAGSADDVIYWVAGKSFSVDNG